MPPMRNGPASHARFCTVIVNSSVHSERWCGPAAHRAAAGPGADEGPGAGRLVGVLGGDAAPVLLPSVAVPGAATCAVTAAPDEFAVLGEQVAVGGHLGQQLAVPCPTATMAAGQQRDPVGQQHRGGPVRRPGRSSAPASRSARSTSASVCTSRPTAGRRAPAPTAGRGRRGPAPAAAAGTRTATGPARRCAWPAPTAGRARTPPAPPAAPRPRRRRRLRGGRG